MPLVPDAHAFQTRLAGLPPTEYGPGENVLWAGETTGKLFVLKSGTVEVAKDGIQLAEVATPGAVFGELGLLMDQPHTADVRTLERSEFHVLEPETLLKSDPTFSLYLAAILARRLDSANRALIEVKRQLQAGQPRRVIGEMVDKVGELLTSGSDAALVYSGYPYDPFAR
jgi:CRP/FNR family transcriptional regulator, cyclic AMP receptor protein